MAAKKEASSDEMGSLEEQMGKLNTGEKRDINILLLGETGVGKSTFINAFCNYLQIPNLKCAMKGKFTTLIPARFTIMDENFMEQVVQVGADTNEFVETGVSATQAARSYVFPIRRGKLRVRLIDTPGIGDTRGIDQDNSNFENVLSFIGELKHLNAICILLKPNNARLTVMFEFCIKQLLSRLEKSASQNLVFIFTNSRSTFYRPGETLPALKKLLETVRSVNIPVAKDNIFCMDNEAFRFLAAVKNGIKFDPNDVENFSQSWKQSFRECWRMISHIAGDATKTPLVPHLVKNTISVNEARRLIVQLSQPLAEIAQLIHDNITVLQRHKASLQVSDSTLTDLKTKLYVPVMNLRVIKMDQPTTVCTSPKCRTLYKVGDMQKWHYHQKCHKPCYLNNVPKEIVGSPELASCAAMNGTMTCTKCSCNYQVHMHIYYETETYVEKLENEAVKSEILDKNFALLQAKNVVAKIERRLKEYDEERDVILKTTAKFAHFLQENAITPYNDAYQAYLRYLIDREQSLGLNASYEMIKEFQRMLQCYNEEKNALQLALSQPSSGMNSITADEIINCVESLYNLKHNGMKIQELFLSQKAARKDENKSETREYVHATAQKKRKKKKNKNKNNNQQVDDTTDSEYATDVGQNIDNRIYNRRFNNRPNLLPTPQCYQRGPYNQQYNEYQQHSNPQQPEMQGNSEKPGPVQYLQIKQDPSGQFDLRFGQTNQDPRASGHNFRSQSPMPYHNQGQQSNQNSGQYGAYPKTYNTGPPSKQIYNKNYQHGNQRYGQSRGEPTARSHSPNPRSYPIPSIFDVSSQNFNQFRGPNQGGGPFNQGWQGQSPNQRGRPYNQGPGAHGSSRGGPYNQGPGAHGSSRGGGSYNQGPEGYGSNHGGRPYNQGPDGYGSNQGGRPYNQGPGGYCSNWGGRPYNQGPVKPFNQGPPNNFNHNRKSNQNQGQRSKSLNNDTKQSDSGCESGGYGRGFNRNRNRGNYVNNNARHFLDDGSSSSSSESSDDESYITCK